MSVILFLVCIKLIFVYNKFFVITGQAQGGVMADIKELRLRVEKLEARNNISELVSSYAVACDEHDIPRLGKLFTEDAIFGSPSGIMTASGREPIIKMFVDMLSIRGPGYHWTHDHFIEFSGENPDQAFGRVYSHAETSPHGKVSLAAMKYDDNYQKVDGRWLFSKRVIQFLYYVPADLYMQGLVTKNRLYADGEQLPADFPESLPAWQEFESIYKPHSTCKCLNK